MGTYLLTEIKMLEDCAKRDARYLVDLGCSLAKDGMYSLRGKPLRYRNRLTVIGCTTEDETFIEPVFGNLYDGVYASLEEIPAEARTDALYLGEISRWGNPQEALGLCVAFLDLFRIVYYIAPSAETDEGTCWHVIRQMDTLSVTYIAATEDGVMVRVEKKPAPASVKLYIAAHKETSFPAEAGYVPLWLGRAEDNRHGYADDKKEPSIADLNPRINECTGLYSIWKHADADIVGLVHYRRLFLSECETDGKRTLIGQDEILSLLSRYDILVYQLECFSVSLREQMVSSGITEENSTRAINVFSRLIAEHRPDYADAFERVMSGCAFYPCNMLIARKEVFDAYCEWLFGFLIEAAHELDFDAYDDANRRTAGFLAERMLTVWLVKQDLKIRELEVTRLE